MRYRSKVIIFMISIFVCFQGDREERFSGYAHPFLDWRGILPGKAFQTWR